MSWIISPNSILYPCESNLMVDSAIADSMPDSSWFSLYHTFYKLTISLGFSLEVRPKPWEDTISSLPRATSIWAYWVSDVILAVLWINSNLGSWLRKPDRKCTPSLAITSSPISASIAHTVDSVGPYVLITLACGNLDLSCFAVSLVRTSPQGRTPWCFKNFLFDQLLKSCNKRKG